MWRLQPVTLLPASKPCGSIEDHLFTHSQVAELVHSYLGDVDPRNPLVSPLLGRPGSPEDMEDDVLAGWYEKGGLAEKVIEVGDMEIPRAGPGEVLVRLRASSINPSDYKKRAANAPPEFPRIVPHSDGAGVVEGLGAGVSDFKVGDRVWTFNAQFKRAMGTAAQYIALPAALVRPLPSNASFVEGACFGIPAMTGFRAVFADGPVKRKTVYVPGGTGRVTFSDMPTLSPVRPKRFAVNWRREFSV
jgi:hypothetical protein